MRRASRFVSLCIHTEDSRFALVRVRACGVCRTDLHVVEGELAPRKSPVVPGTRWRAWWKRTDSTRRNSILASAGGGEDHEQRRRSPVHVRGSLADTTWPPGRPRLAPTARSDSRQRGGAQPPHGAGLASAGGGVDHEERAQAAMHAHGSLADLLRPPGRWTPLPLLRPAPWTRASLRGPGRAHIQGRLRRLMHQERRGEYQLDGVSIIEVFGTSTFRKLTLLGRRCPPQARRPLSCKLFRARKLADPRCRSDNPRSDAAAIEFASVCRTRSGPTRDRLAARVLSPDHAFGARGSIRNGTSRSTLSSLPAKPGRGINRCGAPAPPSKPRQRAPPPRGRRAGETRGRVAAKSTSGAGEAHNARAREPGGRAVAAWPLAPGPTARSAHTPARC
jgi:hypothetical protein